MTLWREGSTIKFLSDFDREFIDELKARIPGSKRKFNAKKDGHDNSWSIAVTELDTLLEIAEKYYIISVINDNNPKNNVTEIISEEKKIDCYRLMFQSVPLEQMKKMYRFLIKSFHPDRGGDSDILLAINQAWPRILDERNNKK